jgi:hypothetical protein
MNFLGDPGSQQCALALLTIDRAMRLSANARKSEDAEVAVARWVQAAPGTDEK